MVKEVFTWINSKIKTFAASAPVSLEEKIRLQHYIIFMILGIPTMCIFGVSNLLKGNNLIFVFAIASAFGLIAGLALLRKIKKGYWVYRSNALLFVCLISYMIIIGGDDGSKALWAYTIPLICCFLFGTKEGGMWSSLVMVIAIFTFSQSTIFSIEVHNYPPSFQVRFIITYVFCTIISMWLEHSRNFFLKQSEASGADLIKKHTKLKEEIKYRKKLEKELITIARIDKLTGILNRGAFFSTAEKEWAKHARNSKPLSFAVLDIDHFKTINDQFGHPAGDDVLINITRCCINSIRSFDMFGRIGGEEFALLFAETELDVIKSVLERLRLAVESTSVEYEGKLITCTISIGLYTVIPPNETLTEMYKKADCALYQAKNSGRNKTFIYR
ncbi:MAG: GGDEF domain-containing protein [Colwellia sp.]|nr:GGDEF domain-containing protein [Colwellia sp.]